MVLFIITLQIHNLRVYMWIFTRLLLLLYAVIIRYPQIGNDSNESLLNALKNSFDRFLVFYACFENMTQCQKYLESSQIFLA
jgi:hypothetical protein